MTIECELTINFGTAGNSLAYLGGGWARSERDFTWGIGAESHVVLSKLEVADEYVLMLDVIPFVHAPELQSQRLIVAVNDIVVGSAQLSRPSLLGYRFPRSIVGLAERTIVTLRHPDATRPIDLAESDDDRALAFSLFELKLYHINAGHSGSLKQLPPGLMLGLPTHRTYGTASQIDLPDWAQKRIGLTVPQIALRFESLGENCEFGLFQRRCGSDPLGLLRFSSTFARNLIRGINNGFDGLGAAEDIDPRLDGDTRKEYMIHERKFGLVYHTFVYEGQRSIWLMREQESARLKFLLRKFMEELELAEKIFVYKRNVVVTQEEILPLHMALNQYGENTLLWVQPAEPDRPSGTVELIMPGLLKGYIDRFAPEDNAHDLSFDGWLGICTNACMIDQLQKPEPRRDGP